MSSLLKLAQKGDNEAFAQLFQEHAEALWRAVSAVLRNKEDAADAMQEAAIKSWRAIPSFKGKSDIGTWFMRIALRSAFDIRRKRKEEVLVGSTSTDASHVVGGTIKGGPERGEGDLPSAPKPCDRNVLRPSSEWDTNSAQDEAIDVQTVLSYMSADDRLVLTLFYGNDMSTAQIAETLGASEGAIRTRLTRARSRFKEKYTGEKGTTR